MEGLYFVFYNHRSSVVGPPTCNRKAIFGDLVNRQHTDINKVPGKHSVPIFLSNWIAGFRGFKLMEINIATSVFQVVHIVGRVTIGGHRRLFPYNSGRLRKSRSGNSSLSLKILVYIEWYKVRVYDRFQSSYGVPRNGLEHERVLGFFTLLIYIGVMTSPHLHKWGILSNLCPNRVCGFLKRSV